MIGLRVWLCVLATAVPAAAQSPSQILVRVRDLAEASLARMSNYMCTQTIERKHFSLQHMPRKRSCDPAPGPAADGTDLRLRNSDRLRMDVARTTAGEMYSWAGENRFEDRDLFEVVGGYRAISTGNFTGIFWMVFQGDFPEFSFSGLATEDGRDLAVYRFQVPAERSHSFFGRQRFVPMAYTGTLRVDARTADPVRLTVRSGGLPRETHACETTTDLHLERVKINDGDLFLPTEAELTITYDDGSSDRNSIRSTGCREFRGESSVTFDAAREASLPAFASSADAEGPAAAPFTLVSGTEFAVTLADDLDTAKAAAGDPIRCRVATTIEDRKAGVFVPKDTLIQGRITRMERFYAKGSLPMLAISARMDTLGAGRRSIAIAAEGSPVGQPFRMSQNGYIHYRGSDFGPVDAFWMPDQALMVFSEPPEGLVVRAGYKFRLRAGTPGGTADNPLP